MVDPILVLPLTKGWSEAARKAAADARKANGPPTPPANRNAVQASTHLTKHYGAVPLKTGGRRATYADTSATKAQFPRDQVDQLKSDLEYHGFKPNQERILDPYKSQIFNYEKDGHTSYLVGNDGLVTMTGDRPTKEIDSS